MTILEAAAVEPVLTIGVPTFERRDTVLRSVAAHRAALRGLAAEILVADNASGDGTADAIAASFPSQDGEVPVRVVRGSENTGLLGNFRRLVDSCTTDYLLLLSDEDLPAVNGTYSRLIDELDRTRPAAFVGGESRSRWGRRPRRVDADAVWAATKYISGCGFATVPLRDAIARIDRIGPKDELLPMWELWPFVIAMLDIVLHGGTCARFDDRLFTLGTRLPSSVGESLSARGSGDPVSRASTGEERFRRSYKSLDARLRQTAAMLAYADAVDRSDSSDVDRGQIARLRSHVIRGLMPLVIRRVDSEHPRLAGLLHRSALRTYGVGGLVRDPLRSLRGRGLRERLSRHRR